MAALMETHLSGARLSRRGKVRELYDLGETLLLVASDRISAFDCVLSPGIPDKGKILTQLSNFWFQRFSDVQNHLVETEVDRLSEPIFTPATKSERGHDENVSFEAMANRLGTEEAERLRDLTLDLYGRASEYAASRGLLLADTKLEFGRIGGRLVWIDEAFTPDSSRYWDAAAYRPGHSPHSLDKQFVRDWLDSTGWDRHPPAPRLPEGVIRTTREKYLEAFKTLTGSTPAYLDQ